MQKVKIRELQKRNKQTKKANTFIKLHYPKVRNQDSQSTRS